MATSIQRETVQQSILEIVQNSMHSKQILSLTNAVQGVICAASLAVSAIGSALATAQGFDRQSAIKQVDRFFSNRKIKLLNFFLHWIPYIVQKRQQIIVSLDWTDFDKNDQSTLCLNVITNHGRATPLLWKTYLKSTFKNNQRKYEINLLELLKSFLPATCEEVIVLADRGFGDVGFYDAIVSLGFNYVIRFRCNTKVTIESSTKSASEWLKKGKASIFFDAAITASKYIATFVCVHDKAMKEAWYLASNLSNCSARQIIWFYGRRFSCEENFRDIKDIRFGMGLSNTSISNPERRDRILLVSAISVVLLTLLGAAGEAIGLDKMFKPKTVERRTHSLFTQGCFYFLAMVNWKKERFELIMKKYAELLEEHLVFRGLFSVI